jgi:predicted Rossmann fold nucleotide-binding protein DprA/Smf involved in DNA uptake
VVVLGCGLDVAYPRANAGLFARVLAGGGSVVSEHPPGVPPRPAHFLPRNRLIAALPPPSSWWRPPRTLAACRRPRRPAAVAAGGSWWSRARRGTRARRAATPSSATAPRWSAAHLAGTPAEGRSAAAAESPGTKARKVLAALVDGGVCGAPRLAALTGLRPADLAAALLELELAGLVRRTAAGVQAVALPGGSRPAGA